MSHLISRVVPKVKRPVILWKKQISWYESMTFSIPLSSSHPHIQDHANHFIRIDDCLFHHEDDKIPRRAMVHQATRIDGNAIVKSGIVGKLTNEVTQKALEDKLFSWLF